ncbi:hypothetical protein Mapa_011379 [Marchantia paleacea]|nr:hypothetical protein Mapa_011379 [Marchantia paleacea]
MDGKRAAGGCRLQNRRLHSTRAKHCPLAWMDHDGILVLSSSESSLPNSVSQGSSGAGGPRGKELCIQCLVLSLPSAILHARRRPGHGIGATENGAHGQRVRTLAKIQLNSFLLKLDLWSQCSVRTSCLRPEGGQLHRTIERWRDRASSPAQPQPRIL